MKKYDKYWVDDNNNRWNSDCYTEEEATQYSNSLINCSYCTNCTNCINCSDCTRCGDCSDCTNCINCSYCKDNPQRYVTPRIGSRRANTTFYWLGDNKHGKAYMAEIEKVRMLMQ